MITVETQKNPAAVALGRLGGLKGGPATAQARTQQERSEAARKAVNARWAKRRAKIAHQAVAVALRSGILERPEICSMCGEKPRPGSMSAHHESYLPEDHLKVQWLCTGCHLKMHRSRARAERLKQC